MTSYDDGDDDGDIFLSSFLFVPSSIASTMRARSMAMFSCSLYVGTRIEYLTVSPPPFGFLVVVVVVLVDIVSFSDNRLFLSDWFCFLHPGGEIFSRQNVFEKTLVDRDEKIRMSQNKVKRETQKTPHNTRTPHARKSK